MSHNGVAGWSMKEAAVVLGVAVPKVSQSMNPAVHKIALLMLADPQKTMSEIANEMRRLRDPTTEAPRHRE